MSNSSPSVPTVSCSDSLGAAAALIELDALRIMKEQPFFYTSGWASPVYTDTRLLMSDVRCRLALIDMAVAKLTPLVHEHGINAIVGAESSGIALAAWLADRLQLPLLYLRKRPLGWGSDARLEGQLPPDARLLLVDDATTDARSKIAAVESLRASGAQVSDCMVVLDYAIYPQAAERLAAHDLRLHSLTTWPDMLWQLQQQGKLPAATQDMLTRFTDDPVAWSAAHGGVGA